MRCSFWLLQRDGDSYTPKGRYPLEREWPTLTVECLMQAARSHIPQEEAQIGNLSVEVYEVRQPQHPHFTYLSGNTAR